MCRSPVHAARRSTRWVWPTVSLLTVLSAAWLWSDLARATDGEGPVIDKVEEDWELVLQTPDSGNLAPQVTTTISPFASIEGTYAVIDFNVRTEPTVEPGGLQIQLWHGDTSLEISREHSGELLHHDNETIAWTTQMRVGDGYLRFKVKDGVSESWGSFGGESTLLVSKPTDVENLNSYTPSTSVDNSGVGFAANRVQSLRLLRVRKYAAGTLVAEDTSAKTVYQHP